MVRGHRGYVFSLGGAGDPPGGMAVMSGREKTVPFRSMPLSVPSGGLADGTRGRRCYPR